jgi:hypothetical protein
MTAARAASGTVHWIGTGLSTGRGLGVLCERAPSVLVWGRTDQRAEELLARLGLSGRAQPRAFDPRALGDELRAGDVVVSMLPAPEHPGLLRLCNDRGAHFACSSYASDVLVAEARQSERDGLVVLTEAGLDPGIDHLLAHVLVAQARARVGDDPARASFTSYCGGLPAVPNAFRYRFSWAPGGVLSALLSPARYIEDGAERSARNPWEACRGQLVGGEAFEAYPNRDSVPFVEQYAVPAAWRLETFIRGTLRLHGWLEAWALVFHELLAGDEQRIDALAGELAARYPTTATDRDRVVLAVGLSVQGDGGASWSGEYVLDLLGDDAESAMAGCVSLPLACGVVEILDGSLAPGLRRAAEDAAEAQRWLGFLREHGIECAFHPAPRVGVNRRTPRTFE